MDPSVNQIPPQLSLGKIMSVQKKKFSFHLFSLEFLILQTGHLLTGLLVTSWGVFPTLTECWPYGQTACQFQVEEKQWNDLKKQKQRSKHVCHLTLPYLTFLSGDVGTKQSNAKILNLQDRWMDNISGSAERCPETANSIHPCSACNGEVDNGLWWSWWWCRQSS